MNLPEKQKKRTDSTNSDMAKAAGRSSQQPSSSPTTSQPPVVSRPPPSPIKVSDLVNREQPATPSLQLQSTGQENVTAPVDDQQENRPPAPIVDQQLSSSQSGEDVEARGNPSFFTLHVHTSKKQTGKLIKFIMELVTKHDTRFLDRVNPTEEELNSIQLVDGENIAQANVLSAVQKALEDGSLDPKVLEEFLHNATTKG